MSNHPTHGGAEVESIERFHQTHISSGFSFRIGEQIPDFSTCFDRQLLILFKGSCLKGKLIVQGACLQSQMTRHFSKCWCCCRYICKFFVFDIPKLTNRAFAFLSSPSVCTSTYEPHRMRKKPWISEIQFLFLREGDGLHQQPKLVTTLSSLLHRSAAVDPARNGDR